MNLSLGEIIAVDIKKSGLSVTHVAQAMGMSRKGLTDLLKRDDMTLSQLNSLSEILQKDYFELYKSRLENINGKKLDYVNEPDERFGRSITPTNEISLSIKVYGHVDTVRDEFPGLIASFQKEAEIRGLHLG